MDAEVVRAQAELNCAESQLLYDAAREALLSSRQALAAATRTTQVLRQLSSIDPPHA